MATSEPQQNTTLKQESMNQCKCGTVNVNNTNKLIILECIITLHIICMYHNILHMYYFGACMLANEI